jgi:hypothetical protein
MPEIGMSVSMSGDGKRSVGHRPQATAPILDSTIRDVTAAAGHAAAIEGTADMSAEHAIMVPRRSDVRAHKVRPRHATMLRLDMLFSDRVRRRR